ncbi:rhamnulokinase [Vibrio mangrovi]|uniref:Rhamnulokinase n=1 Tax=Vibrio mangrovi TaxID=474394 RepID=A0A1Y6IUW9_9VIBR|nr:rhamnulokinase [Vibrio mangrovi]MDW6001358.1 rhamnulokinase [Vibrio mangrovi]SMS00620.1 Rhamnulokinase [Vibrio mangrovi]
MKAVIAIDLGASSGRVMVGYLESGKIRLEEFHRFPNQQVMHGNESCWDLYAILEEIKVGINKVVATGVEVCSLGIDTWGVDFVLLDQYGKHLGEFVSYRDARTEGVLETLLQDNQMSREDIYNITGIQFLPFNTIYQLKAIRDQQPEWYNEIDTLLFVPDYLNYKLCGVKHCEYTNASTSQLLNCREKNWNPQLVEACGAKMDWLLPPQMPNRIIGQYQLGDIHIPVCSVASHDTASAVAATPIAHDEMAYLSSGTWSLIGIESMEPYTGELAYHYNLTNEGGVDGRYRVLKNIMGLWLIQRIKAENPSLTFPDIAMLARQAEPFKYIVNPNDNDFLNPSSMTQAIKQWFKKRDLPAPESLSEVVRCIYDSLTLAYADALEQIAEVSGKNIRELRIVGGGIQDRFLNQLCADVCEIKVSTEPTEASALGNVVNQLIASDIITSLGEARQIIDASSDVHDYTPNHIDGLEQIKSRYQQMTR